MKKITAFLICILLVGTMSFSVCASVPDLKEYGQKTATLTTPFTPLIDGFIDSEEYEIMIPAILAKDNTDDNFFISGDMSLTDAEYVNFYMAADDSNVYFAVEQKDPLRVGHYDALYLQIGVDKTDSYIQIYFPYNASLEILSEKNRDRWQSYYDNFAASFSDDITLYEIAIPREKIWQVFDCEPSDTLLVSLSHRVHYHNDDGHVIVTWGFQNDELLSIHSPQSFPSYGYPNVVKLYDNTPSNESETFELLPIGDTEAPETESLETETESSAQVEITEVTNSGCTSSFSVDALAVVISLSTAIVIKKKR